jgi:uncharacterized 2Fe-2S/4Fe-4S cluster protein (DUF4445 family)
MAYKTTKVAVLVGEKKAITHGATGSTIYATVVDTPIGDAARDVLTADDGPILVSPCGGKGTCGKCRVRVISGEVSDVTDQERKLLSEHEIETGVRLACMTRMLGEALDIEVKAARKAQVLVQGIDFDAELQPNIRKSFVELKPPTLEDQRDDFQRLSDALDGTFNTPLELLIHLPSILRDNEYRVTVVHDQNYIVAVEPGDTGSSNYGVAVDIGTTTVVAYLIDLTTGKQVDVASGLNAQKSHGQDVISRINYTIEHPDGLDLLRKRIINQINNMIWDLAERNSIDVENIYSIALAGNTTMMHLAAGIPPVNIATVPFIPVAKKRMTFLAEDMGFGIPKGGSAYLLPSISGYVGADIVAATLSSGLFCGEALSLLIDIGTNGEIVLGNREGILCCSTAAGPAFEGATIRHGVGGVAGAINKIDIEDGKIGYTTISDSRAIGICGSGIIDAIAMLMRNKLIDETGRLDDFEDTPAEAKPFEKFMTKVDDQPAVELVAGAESESGERIVLSQQDVREVQLAKASIAAGIETLVLESGKTVDDIDVIYLAGGFGSFIDKMNAVTIGLIPKELADKVQVIGNAAGSGAVISLMSEKALAECDRIAEAARYVELSSSLAFQTAYVDNMYFPAPE